MNKSQKELLYTARWAANKIKSLNTDKKINDLSTDLVAILSELLETDNPSAPPEPKRPDIVPIVKPPSTKPITQPLKLLWYPKALKRPDLTMKAVGKYPNGYPMGTVLHWTAGRFDKPSPNNAIQSIKEGIANGYNYWCCDVDGQIIQTNPLDEYGYHAGESAWVIDGVEKSSMSQYLLGIEINCAGKLEKRDGKYFSWYGLEIPESDVRHIPANKENIAAGYYHKLTYQQENEIFKANLWLKMNNPDVFNLDLVLGHDNISGPEGIGRWRKFDPGGSLSMTTREFRELLKKEYASLTK